MAETSRVRPRGRRLGLGAVVVAWGVQAIVTQSLLVREALVLMFGSELAWGIVLFAWLLGVAVGGTLGGWVAPRLRRPDVGLAAVLLALSVAACGELWVFRGARVWLGVGPGELLPLAETAMAAMLFVSPTGALVGVAFPLACCIRSDNNGHSEPRVAHAFKRGRGDDQDQSVGTGPLGHVYALESAGSLLGGAALSFWAVEHLTPIQTLLMCAAISSGASAFLLRVTARKRLGAVCLGTLSATALMVCIFAGDALNRRLVDRRWHTFAPGYELCTEAESKYQNLAVGEREGQFTLYCDGQVSGSFSDPPEFEPRAHLWMCQHPSPPRRVLVLGGSAEGLLAEILLHPVEHVDYVEPDPRQIGLIEPFLADVHRQALKDERVTIIHQDARYYIKTQRDRFDLVIARLAEPTSALRARFYTDAFYRELRRAMTARSVLCLTAAAGPTNLTAESARYLASIRATLRTHFPYVTVGWDDPAQILAATDTGLLSTDPAELTRRYAQRGVQSERFHPLWFEGVTDWLDPDKVRQRADELDAAANVQISTDLRPSVYVQRLMLWERMTSGQSVRVLEWLESIGWPRLAAALVAIAIVTLTGCRLRARSRVGWSTGAIVLSVGTTGFATMALSIVWLFAFQNLYGYVYQRIGWIIALFMGGLVIGCALASRRAKRIGDPTRLHAYLWRRLIAVDVLLALLALAAPVVLPALGAMQTTNFALLLVEIAVSILVAFTGVLGGAAFALAGGLRLATGGDAGTAAGSVVGADHAGACAGALLTGILLLPVFGTAAAAFLLVGMKLGSATLLLIGRRFSPPA